MSLPVISSTPALPLGKFDLLEPDGNWVSVPAEVGKRDWGGIGAADRYYRDESRVRTRCTVVVDGQIRRDRILSEQVVLQINCCTDLFTMATC